MKLPKNVIKNALKLVDLKDPRDFAKSVMMTEENFLVTDGRIIVLVSNKDFDVYSNKKLFFSAYDFNAVETQFKKLSVDNDEIELNDLMISKKEVSIPNLLIPFKIVENMNLNGYGISPKALKLISSLAGKTNIKYMGSNINTFFFRISSKDYLIDIAVAKVIF